MRSAPISTIFVLFLILFSTAVWAQSTGAISGVVTDAASGAPLAGADVLIEGSALSTATDRAGRFTLIGVPAGDQSLLITYLGHREERAGVTVRPGEAQTITATLTRSSFSETVGVTATATPIAESQAQALNIQRTALNITNVVAADQIGSFPDPNAAEAASRIPGVSIARDQGEGRYVLVRGTEARLNSMMIDGERIPAPEGDLRQVALDAVPADQLQSIEVSKAVTPDMDADSIGGAVNLVTKQAVGRPTMLFSLAGGYNALQRSGDQRQFNGTVGRRFGNGRLGLLVGGSGSSLNRGSENFEAVYADGGLSDLQLRDYMIERQRYGVNASGDVRVGSNGSLLLKGIFNEFKDYEINNRIRFRPPNSRIEHVLKNRHQDQHIRSVIGGGQHVVAGAATVDYRLAWAEALEHQPDRLDTIFRQTGVTFAPNLSASTIDPRNIQPNPSRNDASRATLNAWETEIFKTTDRDVTGSVNVQLPLTSGVGHASLLKLGVKVKDKRKVRDFEATTGSPATSVAFSQLQDAGYDNSRFMNFFPAGYAPFPGINADASRSLFGGLPSSRIEIDHEGDAAAYEADEQVQAGYAMAEFFVGNRFMLLPGVRYERTRVDYLGYDVLYDDGGDYASTRPVSGSDASGFFLPGLHARYALTEAANLRAAFTRTLARPNYYDLVPYQLVFQEDAAIARGNSTLKPTVSNNVDVLLERYFESVGVLSGGVFYKRLTDYIFPFRFQEANFGDLYEVTQPRNGDTASLWGMELAFQNRFAFLPAPFDGLGLYANYTWTDSSARFPDRDQDSTLPGQSAHVGNVALWYEKAGFSARSAWNFHGRYVDAVGDSALRDVYYDDHVQWDLSFSQQILRQVRAFVDVLNLTNAPLRYYEGTTTRPIQEEYYRWWATFGVKMNF
jgi:TonB-dependent receptor